MKLSEVLETRISELFGEESTVFNNHNQNGGTFGQFGYYVNIPDKLVEQYEKRIREKDELIAFLKEQVGKR